MPPKLRAILFVFLAALPVDQLAKLWVERRIEYAERVPVLDGFLFLTHVRNPGAAFGLVVGSSEEWRLVGHAVVFVLALVVVASLYRRLAPGDRREAAALGFVLGGAASNLVDRFVRGEVVDYLHARLWGGYAWPDFNLADAFIVVGVGALILDLLASEATARAAGGGD